MLTPPSGMQVIQGAANRGGCCTDGRPPPGGQAPKKRKRSLPEMPGIAASTDRIFSEIWKLSGYTPGYLRMPNLSMTCL